MCVEVIMCYISVVFWGTVYLCRETHNRRLSLLPLPAVSCCGLSADFLSKHFGDDVEATSFQWWCGGDMFSVMMWRRHVFSDDVEATCFRWWCGGDMFSVMMWRRHVFSVSVHQQRLDLLSVYFVETFYKICHKYSSSEWEELKRFWRSEVKCQGRWHSSYGNFWM